MPVTYSQIVSDTGRATLTFPQGSLNVDYYPKRITRTTFAQLDAFGKMSEGELVANIDALIALILSLVKDWDLMEDDGVTALALTSERLADVSVLLLAMVIQAITGDINPEAMTPQD